ncbi:MAG: hypothetical protein JZU50_09705 [Desulfobulbaceae bacterium]|jgi:hypothetical protein|nr:hypothetical protein [Desulfobulbaceae bacterium]
MDIDYNLIKDLTFFQKQFDKLTDEIQQVKVQLKNSPPLEPDDPRTQQRAEWRSWLELQIVTRQRLRVGLTESLRDKGIVIVNLPE